MQLAASPSQYIGVACWCCAATNQHPWSAAQAKWSLPSVEQAACSIVPPQLQSERPRHSDSLTALQRVCGVFCIHWVHTDSLLYMHLTGSVKLKIYKSLSTGNCKGTFFFLNGKAGGCVLRVELHWSRHRLSC